MPLPIPRILIIAGSDSGGGAGIQADIKTVTMLGGHAMTAITAITAQNTLGVQAVLPVPAEMVVAQMRSVIDDIGVDAVKIGMIGSAETAQAVADMLDQLDVPVVLDPVMVATSGDVLADAATIVAFGRLMALASVVTPNIPELLALTAPPADSPERVEGRGRDPDDRASTGSALAELGRRLMAAHGCAVLLKGGHGAGDRIVDRLIAPGVADHQWDNPRIESSSTHGTGCTLASAVATGLGQGLALPDAVARAIDFVRAAIAAAPRLGAGHGPMGHALGVIPFDAIER